MSTARRTLADVLRTHARSRPDAPAFIDGDVQLTWREANARVDRVANALLRAGVECDDRVLWLGQNSFRLQELLLACCKVGAMFCPANWRQSEAELAFVIDDLQPRVVVWQEEEVGPTVQAGRAVSEHAGDARWICHDGRCHRRSQPGRRLRGDGVWMNRCSLSGFHFKD